MSLAVLQSLTRGQAAVRPRALSLRRLVDEFGQGDYLDQALVCYFPAPHSFTGEDVVELHVHGAPSVVRAVLRAVGATSGRLDGDGRALVRPAEPGEFVRRAFDNDRVDLTEVEALADLLAAETEAQRRSALRQLDGGLRAACEAWRRDVVRCMADAEALLDFADTEADVDAALSAARLVRLADSTAAAIRLQLDDGRRGELLRSGGVYVPVLGAPNVGKSSLINALARRDVVIVSSVAGTTRDAVEVALNVGGYPLLLVDTAGLRRDAADEVERAGIARARQRLAAADLSVWMFDVAALIDHTNNNNNNNDLRWTAELTDAADAFSAHVRAHGDADVLVVLNKTDAVAAAALPSPAAAAAFFGVDASRVLLLSCQTGAGVDDLLERLRGHVAAFFAQHAAGSALITRERHRQLLQQCVDHLDRFLHFDPVARPDMLDIAAEELRQAALCIGRISGRIELDDVLDVLFAEFCIGK